MPASELMGWTLHEHVENPRGESGDGQGDDEPHDEGKYIGGDVRSDEVRQQEEDGLVDDIEAVRSQPPPLEGRAGQTRTEGPGSKEDQSDTRDGPCHDAAGCKGGGAPPDRGQAAQHGHSPQN